MSNIIQHLSQDPMLARIIPDIELPTINPNPDVFNALVKSVVSQQLSTKAAATIYQRFLLLFEQGHATPQEILALDPEVLRATGFSPFSQAAWLKLRHGGSPPGAAAKLVNPITGL